MPTIPKVPLKTIFVALWIAVIALLYFALTVENERWSNAISDAFGSALGAVIIMTIVAVALVAKRIL